MALAMAEAESTRNPESIRNQNRMPGWQRVLVQLFGNLWVELFIGLLIVVSVVLTFVEFGLTTEQQGEPRSLLLYRIQIANQALTWFFVLELVLRYLKTLSYRKFLRECWVDLIAILPSLIPGLYTAKILRLVRLLRILRLFGFVFRASSSFPNVIKRGAVEYVIVCGLICLTVLMGTGAMTLFEGTGGARMSAREAFWFSIYTLFAGEPIPAAPLTFGGRVVSVIVMFMGLTIFAMFTGTITAFMVDQLRTKGRVVEVDQIQDHIIICGWNTKAEIIVGEYRAAQRTRTTPIVVVAQLDEPPNLAATTQAHLSFMEDDFTRVSALEAAGIHRAHTCVILSDTMRGRSVQDADARTILAALTVERLNPDIYTCAELHNSEYAPHLQMGDVNDYVVSSEYSAYLLAQAALHRGLMGVFSELLTHQRGNQFYRVPLPDSWVGKAFDQLLIHLRKEHNALLVAVHGATSEVVVNPVSYEFQAGDEVVVIADHRLDLV